MRIYLKLTLYIFAILTVSLARAGSFDDFFQAIRANDATTVASLLERGFDPNARDAQGQCALGLAARDGAEQVVDVLLRQPRLNVDTRNNAGETALMLAALHGRLGIADNLIARGAAITQQGWNALLYAAAGPDPKMVARLLEKGAPIDSRSPNGTTPLMMAARYGNEQSVTILLAHHADVAARNERGMNAADFARSVGRDALAQRLDSR
ncbi:MAG: hypothetical protein LKCHEGNO_00314 [Burkholderiaceae bacterium]|nr:hypothetical protein [Burkholderiaceae bacterium]